MNNGLLGTISNPKLRKTSSAVTLEKDELVNTLLLMDPSFPLLKEVKEGPVLDCLSLRGGL